LVKLKVLERDTVLELYSFGDRGSNAKVDVLHVLEVFVRLNLCSMNSAVILIPLLVKWPML